MRGKNERIKAGRNKAGEGKKKTFESRREGTEGKWQKRGEKQKWKSKTKKNGGVIKR